MSGAADRKREERQFHDDLRSDAGEPSGNESFYAIDRRNTELVWAWLAERVAGKRVLDYGCGNGESSLELAKLGAHAYGIDISPISVRNCEEAAEVEGLSNLTTFAVMDAENLDFENNFFDYVVVDGVLHHLDLKSAYSELARVLGAGGTVIATEALRHNPLISWYRRHTPELRTEWETEHILGKPEIDSAQEFFDTVKLLGFYHLATIAAIPLRNRRVFPTMLGALERVDSVLLRVPGLRWGAWIAVFTLSEPRPGPK